MEWLAAVLMLVVGLVALITIPVVLWGIGAVIALKVFDRAVRRNR